MSNNKKIKIADLDFDSIKSNLKEFLRGQDEFQDFDFDGSGMSILLDVLAYNTHYNAMYDNMTINEMFLDSATKRDSVVSRAKELGYTPRSATSARAEVRIQVKSNTEGPTLLVIPAMNQFRATIDGTAYTFWNRDAITAEGPSTVYTFDKVILVEGEPLKHKYAVGKNTRYIIPNKNVDLSTLTVQVQESAHSNTFHTHNLATSLVEVDSDTLCYWIKEIDDGLYEIIFGNGVYGKGLELGNIIHVNYLVSSLSAANGAKYFQYSGSTLANGGEVAVFTTSSASGGDSSETVESIKFNAPRLYAAQNRAVTTDDYESLIYSGFSEAKSVSVWGGEDATPPVYGKTFICVRPKSSDRLTQQQKSDILTTILGTKNVVSVIPEIVDPNFLKIALDVTVYYNPRETNLTSGDLKEMVVNTIMKYDDAELQQFDGVYRHSKLSRLIDATEKSITNNTTTVLIRRKLEVRYNTYAQYTFNLINPIHSTGLPQENILSTGFKILGNLERVYYLDDDGVGNVRLFYHNPSLDKIIEDPKIGSVDYSRGILDVRNLNITELVGGEEFEISIKPSSYDVVSAYNQVAEVSRKHLKVTVVSDETASGVMRAGKNYKHTTSRS